MVCVLKCQITRSSANAQRQRISPVLCPCRARLEEVTVAIHSNEAKLLAKQRTVYRLNLTPFARYSNLLAESANFLVPVLFDAHTLGISARI